MAGLEFKSSELRPANVWADSRPPEVKLWAFETSLTAEAPLRRWLDEAENGRASKFARASDRAAFVVTRANLRRLLGQELGISPSDVRFRYSALGKPRLAASCRAPDVDFSVSHTTGFSVIALARGCAPGVDVEAVRSVPDLDGIASYAFGVDVAQRLRSLRPRDRDLAFLRCWTAGEALGKATGQGIAGFGGRFPIWFDGSCEPRIAQDWHADPHVRWMLMRLDLGSRYVATLAWGTGEGFPTVRRMPNGALCHATGMQ